MTGTQNRVLGWLMLVLLPVAVSATELETAPAARVAVPDEVVLDGKVEAVHEATMAAQTSGRVTEVLFDVDDYVPKGAVIVRLRDTEQQAALARAQSGLQEAQARLRKASDDRARKEKLLKEQAVSQAAVDAAQAEYKTAQAGLDAARAQVASATEQLEHTRVRAPYSGIVVKRHVEPGESVQPGAPLMTGLSLDALRVAVQVPQSLVNRFRQSPMASVLLPESGKRIAGRSYTIAPRANSDTHSFLVRVDLPPLDETLYPGMAVKVAITTGTTERILVPEQALVHRSEVTGVYVVDAQGIHLRQVRPGRVLDGGQQEILAGLADGEQVALDPVQAAIALKNARTGDARE